MFKAVVGHGHPEFATNRQQDAQEFLLHLLNMIDRNEVGGAVQNFLLIPFSDTVGLLN